MTRTLMSALALSGACLAFSNTAAAGGDLDWFYADAAYYDVDVRVGDSSGYGVEIAGSLEDFGLPVFGMLEYVDLGYDDDHIVRLGSLTLGYAHAIGTDALPASIYGGLHFDQIEIDDRPCCPDQDDSGVGIQLGFRGQLKSNLELHARSKYTQIDFLAEDSELSFRLGGVYDVWGPLSATFDYEQLTKLDQSFIQIGVRYDYR